MKKRIGLILLLIVLPLFLGFSMYVNSPKTVEVHAKPVIVVSKEKKEINYADYINNLRVSYNNNDIIGVIEIPGVLEEIIVQTDNNDYYLKHDLNHNYNINGAAFLDYRNNIRESKKLLVYGHSDPYGELPFVKITGYNKEAFMKEHPYIYIIDSNGKRTYEVFSSYIETKDFDYVNLESFNGLTYKEHLEKLKKKSFVSKKMDLEEDTNILILQTCSFDERVSAKTKYQIVVAKEIKEG